MELEELYLSQLDRQWTAIERQRIVLEAARSANWRVLEAELELDSLRRAYRTLLDDAPDVAVLFHVKHLMGT